MITVLKIYQFDFDKIFSSLDLNFDNSMELTFRQKDIEGVYFDDEKDDFVQIEVNLLERIFTNDVVKILNSCGLTDERIREIYKEHEGYYVWFDKTMFKFQFEIE